MGDDFVATALVSFKPVLGDKWQQQYKQRLKLCSALKAAGFVVWWDSSDTILYLSIQAKPSLYKWVFGVQLEQTVNNDASGQRTAKYQDAVTKKMVTTLTFPAGFDGASSVVSVVLSSWVAPLPVPHAKQKPTQQQKYSARAGNHADDVPVELAAESWFVYPYEIRDRLDQGGPVVAPNAPKPQSSEETVINIVDNGVDKSHPYFHARWGSPDPIQDGIGLIKAHVIALRDPNRISPKLVEQLTAVKSDFAAAIAKNRNGKPTLLPGDLRPTQPLRQKLRGVRHQASMIDASVGKLETAETELSINHTLENADHLYGVLGDVIYWMQEALTSYASRKAADIPDDFDGHGTAMVAAAKSVAPEARIMMWQQGTGASGAGLPVSALHKLKVKRLAPYSVAVQRKTKRPRQILSCSWGESVKPRVDNAIYRYGDFVLRMVARDAVRAAIKKGYLAVVAAGNANEPEAPDVSCFAETGDEGVIVVGGAWWDQGTKLTLSDACHGFVEQRYFDDITRKYQMPQPVPNILGLCGPVGLTLSSGKWVKAPPYVMLPASQNMADHKDYWEAKDANGKSLGVWRRYYGGSSSATAQVAGAAAVLWDLFPELSGAQVKEYLVRGAIPCTAGESYQGLPFDELRQPNNGALVGLVNVARSIELKRQDDAAGSSTAAILAALEPAP